MAIRQRLWDGANTLCRQLTGLKYDIDTLMCNHLHLFTWLRNVNYTLIKGAYDIARLELQHKERVELSAGWSNHFLPISHLLICEKSAWVGYFDLNTCKPRIDNNVLRSDISQVTEEKLNLDEYMRFFDLTRNSVHKCREEAHRRLLDLTPRVSRISSSLETDDYSRE